MTVIRLRISKVMLALNLSVHIVAISAVLFSSVPVLHGGLLIVLILFSLLFQWQRICMRRPDSIVALELQDEVCQPIFRDSLDQHNKTPAEIAARVYSSGLLQILYFEPQQAGGKLTSLCVLRDSCTSEEWRQLRKFLRWRVCF